jgi:hypothetical protein
MASHQRADELFIADWSAREALGKRHPHFPSNAMRLYGRMCRRSVLLRRPLPTPIREWITERLQRDQRTLHMLVSTSPSGRHCIAKAMVTTSLFTPKPNSFEALVHQGWKPLTYLVEWPQPERSQRFC